MTKWGGDEKDREARGVLTGAILGAVFWICVIYLISVVIWR